MKTYVSLIKPMKAFKLCSLRHDPKQIGPIRSKKWALTSTPPIPHFALCNLFQFRGRCFPFAIEPSQVFLNAGQFAVDRQGASGVLIGFGLFQFGGDFSLPSLQGVNLLLQLMHGLLLLLSLTGAGLPFLGFDPLLVAGFYARA